MNFTVLFFCIALFSGLLNADAQGLEDLRENYRVAVSDKEVCREMMKQLEQQPQSNVHLAYWGAFQAMWAKHTTNPLEKLRIFNKGKRNIDKAASGSPGNIEIIFIRHSVQKKSPGFLGYKDNVEADSLFLSRNLNNITSLVLKKMIAQLLINK